MMAELMEEEKEDLKKDNPKELDLLEDQKWIRT